MSFRTFAHDGDVAVFYLARGADEDFNMKSRRFIESYKQHSAGLAHNFYIIYKGFSGSSEIRAAMTLFDSVDHEGLFFQDDGFDIEAYFRAAARTQSCFLFFMNTSSIINGPDWLAKMKRNLDRPSVRLVGATGSYEGSVGGALQFPNPHIRSNAFMMERRDFFKIRGGGRLKTKMDAYELEHGLASMTAQCLMDRRGVLVVGMDGRGFPPYLWPVSGTFRQGRQENLLIGDGQTETFANASVPFKRQLFHLAWGEGGLVEDLKVWDQLADEMEVDSQTS